MVRVTLAAAIAAALVSLFSGSGVRAADVGQSPAFEFEVASIKRNTAGIVQRSGTIQSTPKGEVRMMWVPARSLVLRAYPLKLGPPEIVGLPSWADSERYDVIVRGNPEATAEQQLQMWRALLADRMKLQAHYEVRSRPIYRLVVARADGRLGPQIKRRAQDCPAPDPANRPAPPSIEFMNALRQPGPLPKAVEEELRSRCRSTFSFGPTMYAAGAQIPDLFRMTGLDRPLIDGTGLQGFYDATLTYSRPSGNPPGPDDPPVLFTAVQDQLGLKIEPAMIDDQVVIVDHIERPTEN
jgi:uncharacterized protein (TIGR03435 family)